MTFAQYTAPGLTLDEGKEISEVLQARLHDLNELHLSLKHAHWNVTGPNFIAVHEMLDPEVEAVLAQADETAERIATILRRMGESMQVLAVTHLPQIAAAGEDHFYIYKEHGEASTRSYIRHLTAEERIDEIARMQSGSKLTDVTRAAAKALLENAQS